MTAFDIRLVNVDSPTEVDRLYDICLLTGDAGQDASALYSEPRLLGDLYLGAYLKLYPQFSFALVDDTDTPVGYATGAPDSLKFDQELEESWWPPLREKYSNASFPEGSGDARLVGKLMNWGASDAEIAKDYPAHLHIDILPHAQGGGRGKSSSSHSSMLFAMRELQVFIWEFREPTHTQ
ncbi:hypothetical protein [Timonella sp. A28]|uniref:hypothetical protein n=1 Tax=Timonella sp. A28 TaxID=3442640 RepID=UPI003EBD281D